MMEKAFLFSSWIMATSVGWALGILLVLLFASFFDAIGIEGRQFFIGTGMGAGVGFMQWRVLKKLFALGSNWIWFSILGLTLPFIILHLLNFFPHLNFNNYHLPTSILLGGIIIGSLQERLLKQYAPNARGWTLASFLGWAAAGACVLAIDYTRFLSDNNWVLFSLNLLLMLAGGPLLGLITGAFLKKLASTP